MAVHPFAKAVQDLRFLVDERSTSDAQLLDRFIERRDERAFAAIVHRHGAMVWGVCRRIASHHQDAEDAFQATFLVLARKALSIRPREMLANWLFGVARRTAMKAKAMAHKRLAREIPTPTLPEREDVPRDSWDNLEHLLDQQLALLPDKYRIAVLLCDLEGRKGKDVARQLKIPEGTLASRLRTGRVMLAKRLNRLGVALSGGAIAAMLARNAATAGAPTILVSSTVHAAAAMAAGNTIAAEVASANTVALMEGAMKTMLLTKLKPFIAGLLVLGLLGLGGDVISRNAVIGQQERDEPAKAKPTPSTKAEEKTPDAAAKKESAATDKRNAMVTYAVADLVIPIPNLDFPASKEKVVKTQEAWLIGMITRSIAPDSWEESGGTGNIEYFPMSHALVVNNTASVHAQIQRLLETMRRVQDVQIVAEIQILTLNAAGFRRLQELLPQLKKDEHAILSKAEAFALRRKASDDKGARTVAAPKVVFFPGQSVNLALDLEDKQKTTVKLNGYVAANLRHIEFDLKATFNKVEFAKSLRMEDGTTLVQVKANGEDYAIVLATPRVVIAPEETEPPARDKARK
jgi:RNA polymerase sigma factor (sigma-70 family)